MHIPSRQDRWHHIAADTRVAESISDRRLVRVIEFMATHLECSLTLEQLASEAGVSVHHFGRRLREKTGSGPVTYLTHLRVAEAEFLLKTSDLAIAEVGVRCGYQNAGAFATAFARHVGLTPSGFRWLGGLS